MDTTQEGLSVLIPAFNEESGIGLAVDTVKRVMTASETLFEIIAIDDGSTDKTRDILSAISGIRLIRHKRNKGYGASLKTGMRAARFPLICITDADGTYPVAEIPRLCQLMRENALDMIVGSRNGPNVHYPLIKKIPKFFIKVFAEYIAGTRIPDLNSGLRIFNREVALKFFNLYPDGFSFTTTITMSMLCRGYDVEFTPIDYFKRDGNSKIAPVKDTIGFFSLLAKIAIFFNPMKFFFPLSLIFAAAAVGFVSRDLVRGNLSDSAVLFPLMAMLVFSVGLIADAISRK